MSRLEESLTERALDRRTFIKRGALVGGAAFLGLGLNPLKASEARPLPHGVPRPSAPPNILTIIVDQLRSPTWMPSASTFAEVMPNLAALGERSVSFERHYTAANDCSPARSVLLTGLYTHQTGVMITGSGWLDPRFPTWGTLLRKMGYDTAYYGKWHLNPNPNASLEQYGFSGGTYPSPNGSPGQGTGVDPVIADEFVEWLEGRESTKPWATTVSFVNPHDVAWWYRFTEEIAVEADPPARATSLPANYETPEELEAKGKPQLQRSLQDTAARSFGAVPFTGPEARSYFTQLMDTYLQLGNYVDVQIGRVLTALARHPRMAANTIVVFTSDHGEYAGSHGMRGKGASAYDEAIRVPLYVFDPRGLLTGATNVPRTQLTSSADLIALMLTIASGSQTWRNEPEYAHLASRLDLASICQHPQAAGREWVLHATDEDVTEFASQPYAADAPRHVVALRSAKGKLVTYSNWRTGTMEVAGAPESEFYDYSREEGRLELSSQQSPASALQEELRAILETEAMPQELSAPLPSRLRAAHRQGMGQYLGFEEREAMKVYESHLPAPLEPTPEPQ